MSHTSPASGPVHAGRAVCFHTDLATGLEAPEVRARCEAGPSPLQFTLVIRVHLVIPFFQASLTGGGHHPKIKDSRTLSTTLATSQHKKGVPSPPSGQETHIALEKRKKNLNGQQVAVIAPMRQSTWGRFQRVLSMSLSTP